MKSKLLMLTCAVPLLFVGDSDKGAIIGVAIDKLLNPKVQMYDWDHCEFPSDYASYVGDEYRLTRNEGLLEKRLVQIDKRIRHYVENDETLNYLEEDSKGTKKEAYQKERQKYYHGLFNSLDKCSEAKWILFKNYLSH